MLTVSGDNIEDNSVIFGADKIAVLGELEGSFSFIGGTGDAVIGHAAEGDRFGGEDRGRIKGENRRDFGKGRHGCRKRRGDAAVGDGWGWRCGEGEAGEGCGRCNREGGTAIFFDGEVTFHLPRFGGDGGSEGDGIAALGEE